MILKLPENVKKIIHMLQDAGFEAYAVGGCVRDALLGREPDDWDITTSALPEQVKKLFARTIDTGLQHGTVTVLFRAGNDGWDTYEVTTFRIDGVYEDARHPKDVTFTPSLEEDLKRRDFTINAMAYNETAGLIDCFDGLSDLKDKQIRCVGDPKERFTEDALRMMRAVRFAAQLGFTVVPETLKQIRELAPRLAMISAERIQTELVKLLVSDHPDKFEMLYQGGLTDVFLPEFSALMKTAQHSKHHGETAGEHTLISLKKVRADKVLRLAMLFHDIAKPVCRTTDESGEDHFHRHPQIGAEMTKKILRRLKFDNETTRCVVNLVRLHDERIFRLEEAGSGAKQLRAVRRAVSRNGEDVYPNLFAVMRADILAQSEWMRTQKLALVDRYEKCWREICQKNQCLSIKDLAIDGSDLIAQGIPSGPEIGTILHEMLEDVLDEPENNNKEYLLEHLEIYQKREGK
ncbi:MAG: CCA tRNA nucleotidyltransferase [Eubacterium sp.]|nr:CCA tRNA nucleotidyltransferase [Eubacterium sp.]